jgi:hypothetical protein
MADALGCGNKKTAHSFVYLSLQCRYSILRDDDLLYYRLARGTTRTQSVIIRNTHLNEMKKSAVIG